MTFHFEASLPAHRAFLDPLRELLRQAFAYVGYPAIEASEMAGAIEALVAQMNRDSVEAKRMLAADKTVSMID